MDLVDDLRLLLRAGDANSQEQLCATLEAQGHVVNQSKISRLLRKIGAIKSKNETGQIVYRLPLEPAPPTPESKLSDLVIEMVANESTIIVYTSPGAAQLIARVLDYHKQQLEILGVIAGDDTIFIAPTSVKKIDVASLAIKQLIL